MAMLKSALKGPKSKKVGSIKTVYTNAIGKGGGK